MRITLQGETSETLFNLKERNELSQEVSLRSARAFCFVVCTGGFTHNRVEINTGRERKCWDRTRPRLLITIQ